MIDMTIDMNAPATAGRNHFQGNGNCDATREANKRADHANANGSNGMESEIAPYYGAENQTTPYYGSENQAAPAYSEGNSQTTPVYGGENQTAPYYGVESDQIADGYGTEHEHTEAEEDGMSSFPQDSFTAPLDADEAARNSWRALLARNVGRNVLVRSLVGTQNMVVVEGELYEVGTDYIVIYQPLWDTHITTDLYSVKFVEFREPPGQAALN